MQALSAAAIVHDGGAAGDQLLLAVVQRLQQQGCVVRGLVTARGKDPAGRLPMLIQDVHNGQIYPISQALGPGSKSCSLDPAALSAASFVLRQAVEEKPDLVLINRFGAMEANGKGFASELLSLLSERIAVLTVVSEQFKADWLNFTGMTGVLLPLEAEAIYQWAVEHQRQEVAG